MSIALAVAGLIVAGIGGLRFLGNGASPHGLIIFLVGLAMVFLAFYR